MELSWTAKKNKSGPKVESNVDFIPGKEESKVKEH